MCEKEPKFKVGQRVRSALFGIEGEVLQDDNGPVVVVRVRRDRGRDADYPYRVPKQALEAVEEKPSLVEADLSELEQRIAAYLAHPAFFIRPFHSGGFADALRAQANRDAELAHAAISQIIDGFNKLRADIEDDSEEDNMVEPAVEAMSLLDGLREIVSGLPAHGGGRISEIRDEAVQQIDDLSEVIDELIEQRDAARAEGPEYEFTEEGRTIAPLFVPPGSVATWLFGMGMIETVTGHVDGKKCFEFGVSETPAAPGDVLTGARSREPRIRMVFHDNEAIHRLIADLVLLANGEVQRRANDAE